MDNREEKIKKLKALQQKLKEKNNLPTIKKEDISMSVNFNTLNELKSNNSVNNRIDSISNSITILEKAKETLIENSKHKIEVVFIIDRSGSVCGTEEIVSDGIFKIIQKGKDNSRNEIITITLFNNRIKTIYDRTPIEHVGKINYYADNETALYDTLVYQLEKTKNSQLNDINKPEKTIVVISTDGADNVSKKTPYNARKIIEDRKQDGWEFIFLGTNFDVIEEAMRLGIGPEYAAEYDVLRLSDNFKAIEKAIDDIYEKGTISKDWSKPITEHKQLSSGDSKQYKKLLGE